MKTATKISEYDQQAIDFLENTQTELNIQYLYTGIYFPGDTDKRDIYQFTLTSPRGSYSAKFGDSLNNTKINHFRTEKRTCDYKEDWDFCKANKIPVSASGHIRQIKGRVNPSAYDILSCLDTYCPDTFEDFCLEYGYDSEPVTKHDEIMGVYLQVKEQARSLNAMYSEDQLQELAEIS